MRRNFLIYILLLTIFTVTACGEGTLQTEERYERNDSSFESSEEKSLNINNESEYLGLVEDFKKVSVEDINKKIDNNESFYLYVGRVTCPYCRIFVPKLHSAAENNLSQINYLDVENTTQDAEFESFLSTINLQYVPSVVFFDDEGDFDMLDIDSNKITVQEIKDFIN